MAKLTKAEQAKQIAYRDARFTNKYDDIWQTVGKCAFCDLRDKYIFFEENGVVMTISLYAYIDGHFMIIPRRHVRSAKELNESEWATIRKFTYMAKKLIKTTLGIRGVQFVQKNGIEAQSTVEHLHFHCIPFDTPDLCSWNIRQLKRTPLENVALYKKAAKNLVSSDQKFEQKYRSHRTMPMICDAVITNSKCEVLFQVRQDHLKFSPDYLSLPGGHVDDYNLPFEEELSREVFEETGLKYKASDFKLITSRPAELTITTTEPHLETTFTKPKHFIWNSYIVKKPLSSTARLIPGDDCKELVWVDPAKASGDKRISPAMLELLGRIKDV